MSSNSGVDHFLFLAISPSNKLQAPKNVFFSYVCTWANMGWPATDGNFDDKGGLTGLVDPLDLARSHRGHVTIACSL